MRPLRYSINVTLDGCCDHREMVAEAELGLIDEYEFVVHPKLSPKLQRAPLRSSRQDIWSFAVSRSRILSWPKEERPYDLAFAVRVGALDGRHPAAGRTALGRLRRALVKSGRLFIDGGNPLKEVALGVA